MKQLGGAEALTSFNADRCSLADARFAWYGGEFARCLEILDSGVGAGTSEGILLRARALSRLDRPREALDFLAAHEATHVTVDAQMTSDMLRGDAVTRSLDPGAGLAILDGAAKAARERHAHPTIVIEIAYFRAVALWMLGCYDRSRTVLRDISPNDADIVGARCLQLQVFIDIAEHQHHDAVRRSLEALDAYRGCKARDRWLEATILVNLAVTISEIAVDDETFASARNALGVTDWSGDLGRLGLIALSQFAWASLVRGDERHAASCIRRAVEVAPSAAWRVFALAERAMIFRALGETHAAADHLDHAQEIARCLDWAENAVPDEAFALLALAEALAPVDPDAASSAYATYAAAAPSITAHNTLRRDKKLEACSDLVLGRIALARGKNTEGARLVRRAWSLFREMGYTRRMLDAALVLAALPAHRSLLDTTLAEIGDDYRAWTERFVEGHNVQTNTRYDSLTAAEQRVLRVAMRGVRPEQIARTLGSKTRTIYNHLTAIRRKYGVTSHAELLTACARDGISAAAYDGHAIPASDFARSRADASTDTPAEHRLRRRVS